MPSIVQINVTQTVGAAPATLQSSGALVSQGATNTAPGTVTLLTQLSDLTGLLNGSAAITSAIKSGGVVTVTTTAPHGLTIGDNYWITIAGVSPAGYNGSFDCTITGTSTFTYVLKGSALSTGSGGAWTLEDVAELNQMATTWFAQGSGLAVSVLELGAGSVNDGVAALTSYLNAYPNSDYTPGATGYFYAYCVPREWDGNANFLTLLQSYEGLSAKTYFFITTTLATYASYTNLMKCAVTLIESPAFGAWPANVLTAIAWSANIVTAATTTAHGVLPGQWFTISGCTPSGYNGTFQALQGTAGTTLLYALPTDPSAESVLGTLVASTYANAGATSGEFSIASLMYRLLNYAPSAANLVAPFAFGYVVGVTPFPTRGQGATLAALKAANVNIIGTGAEGGISNTIILWGTAEDGHDLTYWYSVDWMQINQDEFIANAIINGSNNAANPLYYDQNGINRLLAVAQGVANRAIAFGLALGPVTVTAVPFVQYVTQNPSDYPAGIYRGLGVSYTPQRGFIEIFFNINVTDFPAAG